MTESKQGSVHAETVRVGDTEMTINYSDIVWGDLELPEMALELSGANYHAQLNAIRQFLMWQDQAATSMRKELDRSNQLVKAADGNLREWLNDDLIELWQSSVYEDATRSMAAAVMLAPLIESLFARLTKATGQEWRGRNVPSKIMKIVDQFETSLVPKELEPTLRALFTYRNKMFHWGLEWPSEERREFRQFIRDSGWPDWWFSWAEDRRGPWIFYLTEEFVTHCLDLLEGV